MPDAPSATGAVVVWDLLLYLVEVTELAARVATKLECQTVTIHVVLGGVAGRQLIAGDWGRAIYATYLVSAERLEAEAVASTRSLVTGPRDLAVKLTQQLLAQFGADISDQVLMDWQEQVFGTG